jgi:hypothetical protein
MNPASTREDTQVQLNRSDRYMQKVPVGLYCAVMLAALNVVLAGNAALKVYDDRASFQEAVGSAPLLTQTFDTNSLSVSINVVSNQVLLQWQGLGVLEEAPTASGPWVTSSDQANPQTRAAVAAQFYHSGPTQRARILGNRSSVSRSGPVDPAR